MKRNFADPFDRFPALEREIVRLRTCELTLVLYYKEEIERDVVDKIDSIDRNSKKLDPKFRERAPRGAKKRFLKAISAMLEDGAITKEEKAKFKQAVEFRNTVGHEIDRLFFDVEQTRFTGRWLDANLREKLGIGGFDHDAVNRMRQLLQVLDRVGRTHYRIGTFRQRGHLMFSSTEKFLLSEIELRRQKISKLLQKRDEDIRLVNEDLRAGKRLLNNLLKQDYFSLRHNEGRMTARGEEFCYRLFDEALSDLSIAHLFEMKLRAIQMRKRKWVALGGAERTKPDWSKLPIVVASSRFDD